MPPIRHFGEGRNPGQSVPTFVRDWTPAFAGVTGSRTNPEGSGRRCFLPRC
jgi:hypothetical protein